LDYWYHHDPYHHKDIDEPLINTPHGYLIYEDVFYAIFYYPFFIIFMSLTFIILSLKYYHIYFKLKYLLIKILSH
jgi:hypothetical protein